MDDKPQTLRLKLEPSNNLTKSITPIGNQPSPTICKLEVALSHLRIDFTVHNYLINMIEAISLDMTLMKCNWYHNMQQSSFEEYRRSNDMTSVNTYTWYKIFRNNKMRQLTLQKDSGPICFSNIWRIATCLSMNLNNTENMMKYSELKS